MRGKVTDQRFLAVWERVHAADGTRKDVAESCSLTVKQVDRKAQHLRKKGHKLPSFKASRQKVQGTSVEALLSVGEAVEAVSSVMRVARVGWPAQDSVDRLLAGVKSPGPFPSHKSGEDRAAKTLREVWYFLRAVRLVMGGRFVVKAKGGGLVKFMPNLIQLQVLGALFEEVELQALWTYLQSVPPIASEN
jgi:hypothetical protein